MPDILIILALSYFIGTIPLGLIIKARKEIAIWPEEEETLGVMKIRRLLGVEWGALLLMGYFLKGYLGLMISNYLWGNDFINLSAAMMIILGQIKSHFSNEVGGVMPIFIGIVYFWDLTTGGTLAALWISTYLLTKRVDFTHLATILISPILLLNHHFDLALIIFGSITALFLIRFHITNSKVGLGERGN